MTGKRDSLSERERSVYFWLGFGPPLAAVALLAIAFLWLSGAAFFVVFALAVLMLLVGRVFVYAHENDIRVIWNHWPRR